MTSDFSFQCALFDAQTRQFLCGCSIISQSWVLTAASCFRTIQAASNVDRNLTTLQVALGSPSLAQPSRLLSLSRSLVHPTWSYTVSPNARVNLAWMQLVGPSASPFTAAIRPVVLASPAEASVLVVPGVDAVVAGWGSLSSGAFPTQLQSTVVAVQALAACNALLSSGGELPVNNASELCAGTSFSGPCAGDTGGALTAAGSAGMGVRQIGVVSRIAGGGATCAPGVLGIYTQVAPYRDFIQASINEPLYAGGAAANGFSGFGLMMIVIATVMLQ